MAGIFPSSPTQPPQPTPCALSAPVCPVCTGTLIYLRGSFRCARCSFTICEECDGGPAEPLPSGPDY